MKAEKPYDGSRVSVAWEKKNEILVLEAGFGAKLIDKISGTAKRLYSNFSPVQHMDDYERVVNGGRVVATAEYNSRLSDPAWKNVQGEARDEVYAHTHVDDRELY